MNTMTLDELYEEFESLADWEEQCSFLIDLGAELPPFPAADRNENNIVHGCQSRVWLTTHVEPASAGGAVSIHADSDTKFVKGLVAILIAAYAGRTPNQLLEFDIRNVFDRLGLHRHLMPNRKNGLNAMVERIRCFAKLHSDSTASLVALPTPKTRPRRNYPSEPLNGAVVRQDFPVLNQTLPGGFRPAYLDNGASAQKPRQVIEKEREVEEQYFANAYRGRYSFGARVDDELEASRAKIADFLHAVSPSCVAFTPGTTIGLNQVAFGWGRTHVEAGDEILITMMEHHANFVPWQQLAKERKASLKFIPMTSDGRLDLNRLDEVLTFRTKMVAVCGMSNVLGTVNPVHQIAARARAVGACVVVDGAQSVPHLQTDMQTSDIDFLVFSGHKLYGPTGVGVICGKPEMLAAMEPIFFGGHMIERVYADESTWAQPPARFEAGTLPIVQAIALGAAIDWVESHGLERIHNHEQTLLKNATERLQQIPGLKIFGPPVEHKGAIISFRIDDLHPEDLATVLDQKGIFTRHGHHCTMPLHDQLGVSATTRASFGAYNTVEDIDRLIEAIETARIKFGH